MARKKNSGFVGASIADTRADQPTFRRLVEDGIGDTALIFDMLTGENGEANTITHAGGGRGCPLGLPLVNQYIGRSLKITSPSSKDTNGGIGQTIIAPYVLFVPPGETSILVRVYLSLSERHDSSPRLVVMSADGLLTVEHDAPMARSEVEGMTMLVGWVVGLSSGYHLVFPTIDTAPASDGITTELGTIHSVIVHYALGQSSPGAPQLQSGNAFGVSTPGATEGLFHRSFDEALFADEDPICSYLLGGWNRNLNGIDEYLRGWPAGGNAEYTHEDQDSGGTADAVDPARSRFEAHTRALYASEGEPAFPVVAESFGAWLSGGKFTVDLAEPPTIGLLDWYAPWPISTSAQLIRSVPIVFPDFQNASSNLKMAVLIGSDSDADVDQWSFFGSTSLGNSGAATPVDLGDGTLWLAEIDGIPFDGDFIDPISVRCSRSGSKSGVGELAILSACVHFEP